MPNDAQHNLESTIFLDRTHGKRMAELLRRVGFEVVMMCEHWPGGKDQYISDPQWIAECGKKGWVAISGDKRLEHNVTNKHAVKEARCRVFILGDTNSRPEEWAAAVMVGRRKIQRIVRKNSGPFFSHISKHSDGHVSHPRFP